MSSRKNLLIVFAIIFGILALVFYFSSIKAVDRDTARYLGTSSIVNIQGTVFAAACAILCVINIVGAIVIGAMESLPTTSGPSSSSIAKDVVDEIKRNEQIERQKQEKNEKEKLEKEKQREITKQRIDELRARSKNGETLEEEVFLDEIAQETSMKEIWNIWNRHNLNETNEEAAAYIQKYKDMERMYGRISNLDIVKEQIRQFLLP